MLNFTVLVPAPLAIFDSWCVRYGHSAAHLSNNDAAKALADAELCIKANNSWAKGFTRKGAALHKLKRWAQEAVRVC